MKGAGSGTPTMDEELIDALVGAWDAGAGPDLETFIASRGTLTPETLVELARIDQDARWRRNERVPAEAYLERFEALRENEDRALDLIHSEVLLREEMGETLSPAEYYNRFPQRVDALQRQFAVHEAFVSKSESARVGSPAPDFVLPSTKDLDRLGDPVKLADYHGKWLVLFFYPHDFSMVCPTEIKAFSRRYDEFRQLNTEVLGVSTDPVERHAEWVRRPVEQSGLGGLRFPLASDATGEVSARYGVLLPEQGVALRGLFILDPGGIIQYQVVHNLAVGRRSEVILRVLRALQTGGACGEDWEEGAPTLDRTEVLEAGQRIAHFEIQDVLGKGSSSMVYRAMDTKLRRSVALKVLRHDDPKWTQRLLAEARSTAALDHPNICVVYEVGDDENLPYIAMQFVPGVTLLAMIGDAPMAVAQIAAIGTQIADALAAAHASGIVHGDLKPHNVMVSENGHVTLVDFGLAKYFSTDQQSSSVTATLPMVLAGTPAYMSPEQVRNEPLNPRSDVFSLGIVLYHMATGSLPFPGRTAYQVTSAILNTEPRVPPFVDAALAEIVSSMLQKSPDARPASMTAVRDALSATASGLI